MILKQQNNGDLLGAGEAPKEWLFLSACYGTGPTPDTSPELRWTIEYNLHNVFYFCGNNIDVLLMLLLLLAFSLLHHFLNIVYNIQRITHMCLDNGFWKKAVIWYNCQERC